jgi:3-methyladenine DNA glycosylase AlkD
MDSLPEWHRRITRMFMAHQQGAVVQSMENAGLMYRMNYGLSVREIKKIAEEWEPNHAFALSLFTSDVRESQIAALYMFPRVNLSRDEINRVCSGIHTVELAEQAVKVWLGEISEAGLLLKTLCQSSLVFEKMTGFLLMARLFITRKIEPGMVDDCYRMAVDATHDAEKLMARSISRALIEMAEYDKELRSRIIKMAARNRKADRPVVAWIAEEILTVTGEF